MDAHPRRRWGIVACVFLTTVIGYTTWASAFPLLTLWVRDLGISHAQGGFLFGIYYLSAVLVSVPASWLFLRFPARRVFQSCWVLIAAGTVGMAMAPNYWALCGGRLLFTIGLSVHVVGAPKTLAAWFEGRRELGFVMAVFSMAMSVGSFCGLKIIGEMGMTHGWRLPLYLLAALAVVGVGVAAVFSLPQDGAPPPWTAAARPAIDFRALAGSWPVWMLALGYFFFNMGSDSFLAFTPDYLVHKGYNLASASAIVGSYALTAIIVKLTTSPFLKARNVFHFVLAGCILGMLSDAAVLQGSIPPRMCALMIGCTYGLAMPALYALPVFLFGNQRAGLLYGVYQFFAGFGIAAQTLIGFAFDRTQNYVLGYGLMFSLFAFGLICIALLWRVRANCSREPWG